MKHRRIVQGVLATAMAAAAAIVPAQAAQADIRLWVRDDVTGVIVEGISNMDCQISVTIHDIAGDGMSAGIRLWINDAGDYYQDAYNLSGNGSSRYFRINYPADAAVSVRAFRGDAGRPVAWGAWLNVC